MSLALLRLLNMISTRMSHQHQVVLLTASSDESEDVYNFDAKMRASTSFKCEYGPIISIRIRIPREAFPKASNPRTTEDTRIRARHVAH
ncbi:hypothetical protein BDZ45DRAFT_81588 [Acephala macrosclerotiorum]|nr:hypothetical protein BDZ45DRAFT_81588 [Acephala macrosclerotiorum]